MLPSPINFSIEIFQYLFLTAFLYYNNKKQIIFMKILNLFVVAFILITLAACSEPEKIKGAEYNRSYSYGAQMAFGLEQMGFTAEEKNIDKFLEGFKAGLTVDSAAFAAAQGQLRERMSSKVPSSTPEQAQAIAYAMGLSAIGGLAMEVEIPSADFDLDGLKEGFVKATAKDSLMFNDTEMDSILKAYFNPKNDEYRAKQQAKQEAAGARNIEAGAKFLAENGQKEGVVTTASGLQYQVLTPGKGAKPKLEDQVKTHYHGTLIDGTIFDSSVDRGEPATFPVNGVIQGWQEGIPLMSVGAKYRFFIPQNLAYGMQSPSPVIQAGSALIFEVELLEINPK